MWCKGKVIKVYVTLSPRKARWQEMTGYVGSFLRTPQGTILARAVAFNKNKVQQFFHVYRGLETHPFTPARVWNKDETGITNVQKPGKIVATKGVRQVRKMTSEERGAIVTVLCAVSAAGHVHIPSQAMVAT